MQFEAIEKKIREAIIARQFPEMSGANVTHQTYQSAEDTLDDIRGRMRGISEGETPEPGSARHQFIYQKQFGEGETALHRTVIVITDDEGEVQRVFRSR